MTTTPDIRPVPLSITAQVDAIIERSKPESTVVFAAVIDRDGWRTAVLVRPPGALKDNLSFGGFVARDSDKPIEKPFSYGAFIRAEF